METAAHLLDHDKTYTIGEIKVLLGVSTSTVHGILRANILPHSAVNGQIRIPKSSFDLWFDTLKQDMNECQHYG